MPLKLFLTLTLCLALSPIAAGERDAHSRGEEKKIVNDIFWDTVDGRPIYSQGGGIFRYPDAETGEMHYYWYGVRYAEAARYREDPSVTWPRCTFEAVTCYRSDNLVDWTFVGDVLTREEVDKYGRAGWVGRMGVAYLPEWNKYVLLVQHDNGVLFALSDKPDGHFTWHRRITMEKIIGTPNTGDQTVFVDEDAGKSYLIYSYGRGRNRIYVSEIGVRDGRVDLLDCTQVFKGAGREGNCLFKYKGRYYMCASNLYGWDSSFAYYLVADDIRGPYEPVNDMQIMPGCADDYAHITQTGFFYTLRGTHQETVLYCGDRWADFAGNGLGYNQWCPLSFDGKEPYFNSLNAWYLNAETGEWRVAEENNYVKNGSFEADRRPIPCPAKPVQDFLLGWTTEVVKGNAVKVGDDDSPRLNYENTADDRKTVIGEKSLYMSDKVDFERRVFQTIASTPYVSLPDGLYTLEARLKHSDGFDRFEMYAESGDRRYACRIKGESAAWKKITIKRVKVKDGKVEIGFYANARAGAWACIDDVVLSKRR